MMFSLMLISFCTLLPCLIPQSLLQCPGSTLGKSHWPIKSNISHSQHIYHFVSSYLFDQDWVTARPTSLGRGKQSEISNLYFLPTNAHLFYVGKYIFTPSVLKIFLVGYFSLKKNPNLNIYISGSLGLEGEISLLPCQASDWPSRIYQSGNEALHVF